MQAVSLLAVVLPAFNEGICLMELVFRDVMSSMSVRRDQTFGGTSAYPADGGGTFLHGVTFHKT